MITTSSEHVVYLHKLFWMSKQKQKTICVHNMFSTCSERGIFMYWTHNSMNNLWSYCGLVDAKISASEKYLPVLFQLYLPRRLTTELFLMRNPIWSPTTFNLSESVNWRILSPSTSSVISIVVGMASNSSISLVKP